MKVLEITSNKLKRLEDEEITEIHKKIHQLYNTIKQRRSTQIEFGELLKEKHDLLVRELRIRELEHRTPIV